MTAIKDIKFTSWNVRGMVKLTELKQVITRLKQLKSSIVFIQETHLLNEDLIKITKKMARESASFLFPLSFERSYDINS